MNEAPKMAFAHMGIYVIDMAQVVDFYTRVLGFCITDRALIRGANVVFLSRDPEEHHQIVLVPGRDRSHASTINQISFRWSIYFADPEGNRIELFVQTPWYIPPVSLPLDFGLSDEEIYRLTAEMVEATPGHMQRALWHEQTRRRMIEDGTIEQRE